MKTKIYVTPAMEVVTVDLQSHILDISVPIGIGAGPGGGGQTRQGIFDDEDSSDKGSGSPAHPNLWDE